MREMNVILADIVTANGGTVTPPITRNGLLSDWLEAITPTQQVFITLNGTDAHYTLENSWTAAGDFEIEFEFATTNTSVEQTIVGSDDVAVEDTHRIYINTTTGDIVVQLINSVGGTAFLAISGVNQATGELIKGTLTREGDIFEIIVGVNSSSNTFVDAAPFRVNFAGKLLSTNFFDGILANPKLTDLATPSNSESWQLNRPFPANTEQSSSGDNLLTYVNIDADARELFTFNQSDQRWDGSNEGWTNPASSITSPWLDEGNGVYSIDGSQGGFVVLDNGPITDVGLSYVTKYEFFDITAGICQVKTGATIHEFVSSDNVFNEVIISGGEFGFHANEFFVGKVKETSIKRTIQIA